MTAVIAVVARTPYIAFAMKRRAMQPSGWRQRLRREVRRKGVDAAATWVCAGLLLGAGGLLAARGPAAIAITLLALGGLIGLLAAAQTRHWLRTRAMERQS